VDQQIAAGQRAVFGVVTHGHPAPSFRWFKSDEPIAGATQSVLLLPSAQAADAGIYSVRIAAGTAPPLSVSANLTVTPGNNAHQRIDARRYTAGTALTVTNLVHLTAPAAQLTWRAQLPPVGATSTTRPAPPSHARTHRRPTS
jgi:hypothetical protein